MKSDALKITSISIKDVKPYKDNAKIHDQSQVEKIAASIKQFGWDQPIVVNKKKVIIKGHGRYEAAKFLKMKEVPCLIVDLSPDDEKASRIADNRVAESEWDDEKLKGEIESLDGNYDLDLLGFDKGEIDILLQGWVSDLDDDNDHLNEDDLQQKPEKEHYVVCPECKHKFQE